MHQAKSKGHTGARAESYTFRFQLLIIFFCRSWKVGNISRLVQYLADDAIHLLYLLGSRAAFRLEEQYRHTVVPSYLGRESYTPTLHRYWYVWRSSTRRYYIYTQRHP